MFGMINKLLGRSPARPETVAPAKLPAAPDAIPPAGFLASTPVFDRKGRIAAHFLRLSDSAANTDALMVALAGGGLEKSPSPLFLTLPAELLWHPLLDRLAAGNIVLLLTLTAQTPEGVSLSERMKALRDQTGLRIGLFRAPDHPAFAAAMAAADYAAIDSSACDPEALRSYSAAIRASDAGHLRPLIACHVATPDEYRLCQQWHYDLFFGSFAEQAPPPATNAGADPHKLNLLHLLRLVQSEADTSEIAEALKRDPLLSFRILRYLNSPLIGLTRPVDSINQALTILGRQRLTRWLAVLLFSVREPGIGDWLVVESALIRARMMELLASAQQHGNDEAFLTGLFSCLERLMHAPLAQLLEDIPVSAGIRSALIDRTGPLATLLALAEAGDSFDPANIAAAAEAAALPASRVNDALLQATAWASEVTAHWD